MSTLGVSRSVNITRDAEARLHAQPHEFVCFVHTYEQQDNTTDKHSTVQIPRPEPHHQETEKNLSEYELIIFNLPDKHKHSPSKTSGWQGKSSTVMESGNSVIAGEPKPITIIIHSTQ